MADNLLKKIYIATPVDYENYGNRLQNFAIHLICMREGLGPVTLGVDNVKYLHFIPKHFVLWVIDFFGIDKIISKKKRWSSLYKSFLLWKFTQEYVETKYVDKSNYVGDNDCDFVGIGGDQIWSPYWHGRVRFCNFPFVDRKKKICFAPSFGSDILPQGYLEAIKPELEGIEYIAVREISGKKIINELLNRDAEVVADPVLLLSKNCWEQYALNDKLKIPDERIAVSLLLGDCDKEVLDWIQSETKNNELALIDFGKKDGTYKFVTNPFGFVKILAAAEWVLTDSFHTALFALIFGRRLILFKRQDSVDMNTRLENITELYGLKECWFHEGSKIDDYYYDKELTLKAIDEHVKKTIEYFKRVI